VIIMIGATILTAVSGPVAAALFPFVVGVPAGFVSYGRWQLAGSLIGQVDASSSTLSVFGPLP
jgi:hypothetical protein